MSGSHKAAFSRPDELSLRDSLLWESYTCSPGSAVIFTEGLCHTGQRWSNKHRDRLSLFTCYDTVNSKWGKGCPPEEVIAEMPPLRRTLLEERGMEWEKLRGRTYIIAIQTRRCENEGKRSRDHVICIRLRSLYGRCKFTEWTGSR